MNIEQLIELVKLHSHIYDKSKKSHRDKRAIENSWLSISNDLGGNYSAIECQKRWKLMRDRFTKEHKLHVESTLTNDGKVYQPGWEHYTSLTFLLEHLHHRSSHRNSRDNASSSYVSHSPISQSSIKEEIDVFVHDDNSNLEMESPFTFDTNNSQNEAEVEVPNTDIPQSKKRKLAIEEIDEELITTLRAATSSLQTSNALENEDDCFGKLIAAELKLMNYDEKKQKKKDIMNILYN